MKRNLWESAGAKLIKTGLKKNFVEGKISLDQKFKKKSCQNQQVWELKFEKKKDNSQLESQNPNSKKESRLAHRAITSIIDFWVQKLESVIISVTNQEGAINQLIR